MAENKQKKVTPIIIEGFEVNGQNTNFQKLQEFSLTLFEKLLTQRKQRNFLLLERDKLRTILENTQYDIRLTNDIGRNKDEELEEAEDKYRQELNEVDQEVKYICYNHEINLTELKAWEEKAVKKNKDKQLEEELELLKEKRTSKEDYNKEIDRCNNELCNLKDQHLNDITVLKQEIHAVQIEKESQFRVKFNKIVEELNLKHEMEISELEERKNTHIYELKKIHKERVDETKDFFNTITSENLTVISNLKESLERHKKSKNDFSSEVKLLRKENERLREPLAKSKAEVKNLTRQLINYEKDLLSLKNNKRMLNTTLEQAKVLRKDNNLSLANLRGFETNSPSFYIGSTCVYSTTDLMAYSRKRKQLEELIYVLSESLKEKQNIIQQFTGDSETYQLFSKLKEEYWNPKQLSYELAIISKAHDELLRTLEEKLEEFCVPERDLGFQLIGMPYTGAGSAALVTNQNLNKR